MPWKEVYAAIYSGRCDCCGKKGTGWFFLLNGSWDNEAHCSDCHESKG